MPAVIVFILGVLFALVLVALGPHAGWALVIGLVLGVIGGPFVRGLVQNW